ncbi:hypothetical protein VTO42DRAFT_6520 [Malbranchea cinnamomea]
MPPRKPQQTSNQEEKIQLAIQAYQRGQVRSLRKASALYSVPFTTLRDRYNGRATRENAQEKNRKLSKSEEITLTQQILSMDERGKPLRAATVREMANALLAKRDESTTPPTVGKCWVNHFMRRNGLESRFSRKCDYRRALYEDPNITRGWFQLVQNTIEKYGILPEDIYNFDEVGFLMGMIETTRVVTGSEKNLRPSLTQSGNREWVTVIQGVNASGWCLPPMFIVKGKNHQASWYQTEGLPEGGAIGSSENGWTNKELGVFWLKEIFNRHTLSRTIGRYRLLILDGHGSHSGPEFDQFCMENSIIPLYMPPRSAHLLQPLDVSCFAPLKQAYGQQVQRSMMLGINHIDRDEFFSLYSSIRTAALTERNIKSGFRATGLVPYDPEQVLSRLNTQVHTPTPQGHLIVPTPPGPRPRRTQSPPSPTTRALDQLVKGCRMAMHSAAILAAQNKELLAANEKQKRKRERRHAFMGQEGALNAEEGMECVQRRNEDERGVTERPEERPQKRVARRCSICGAVEHTARTCSQRTRNSS